MIATLKAKLCGAKLYSPSNLIEVLYVIKYTCKKTPRCKARGFCLQKLYVCDILVMKRQPPTRWVAEIRFVLKNRLLSCKLQRRLFYLVDYFLFLETNVSNASINRPKVIRSWNVKYTIDITSIPTECWQRHPATRLLLIF